MAEIQNAVYQPPKKVYHMDLQQVLGDVGLGNNKKELKNDAPKRYPWLLTDNGEKMEIKAGPDINKYFDEINQNLNVSYSHVCNSASFFKCFFLFILGFPRAYQLGDTRQ